MPVGTNEAFLVWIPKSEVITGPTGVASVPGDLRPVSLKNSAAKVMWKVFAAAVRDGLAAWTSEEQRGFVHRGRKAVRVGEAVGVSGAVHALDGAVGWQCCLCAAPRPAAREEVAVSESLQWMIR